MADNAPLTLEAVFAYIAQHPGCDVRGIERHVRSSGTTWTTLRRLEADGRITMEQRGSGWQFFPTKEE